MTSNFLWPHFHSTPSSDDKSGTGEDWVTFSGIHGSLFAVLHLWFRGLNQAQTGISKVSTLATVLYLWPP